MTFLGGNKTGKMLLTLISTIQKTFKCIFIYYIYLKVALNTASDQKYENITVYQTPRYCPCRHMWRLHVAIGDKVGQR